MTITVRAAEHTGITVADLDRALAFWRDLLGCAVLYRTEISGAFASGVTGVDGAEVSIVVVEVPGGHRIELLQYAAPPEREHLRPRPCDIGSVHVALTVDGLDELLAGAERLGWTVDGAPQRRPSGPRAGSRFVYLRDPDGTTVELIEPPS